MTDEELTEIEKRPQFDAAVPQLAAELRAARTAVREIHNALNAARPGWVGGPPAHRISVYETAIDEALALAEGAL